MQKWGLDGVGGRQKYNANPMESLWNSYGVPMEFLWSNTPTTRQQQAEGAGAGRRGSDELTELRCLAGLAGAEGFAGWRGLGRKEEAKAKVPARGFDWAPDGIPVAPHRHPTVTPP
jgi:hypothetical protein